MHELGAILYDTEALIRVILPACLDINEVLLDVVLCRLELLLLFNLLLHFYFFTSVSSLRPRQFGERDLSAESLVISVHQVLVLSQNLVDCVDACL